MDKQLKYTNKIMHREHYLLYNLLVECKHYIMCLYSAKLSNCGKLFRALTTTYYWRQ